MRLPSRPPGRTLQIWLSYSRLPPAVDVAGLAAALRQEAVAVALQVALRLWEAPLPVAQLLPDAAVVVALLRQQAVAVALQGALRLQEPPQPVAQPLPVAAGRARQFPLRP